MSSTKKVISNSIWLISQQLLLNVISITVIGYIARKLGQNNYGIFMFVFSFTAMFVPMVNMGLGSVMTRAIAQNKSDVVNIVGKIFTLKILLASVAFITLIIVINLLHYSPSTKIIVYIVGTTLFLSGMTSTLTSALQGFEKMHYVAMAQFISGIMITVLSVVVLFYGYGLRMLVLVSCFGQLVWLLMIMFYYKKEFGKLKLLQDKDLWKSYLRKGKHFVVPSIVSMIGAKIGIVMISAMAGDKSAGIFGAANTLVEKLVVIPDGITTAIFPAMAVAFQQSRDDAVILYKNFYTYLFLLALPICIGTTLLAKPIILLIFGQMYLASVHVLQILIWWLFFMFLNMLLSSALSAIHEEKKSAIVTYISIASYILVGVLLISHFKEVGIAVAYVISGFLTYVLLSHHLKKKLNITSSIKIGVFKCVAANVTMAMAVYFTKSKFLVIPILTGVIVYAVMVYMLGLVSNQEILKLWSMVSKRNTENRV